MKSLARPKPIQLLSVCLFQNRPRGGRGCKTPWWRGRISLVQEQQGPNCEGSSGLEASVGRAQQAGADAECPRTGVQEFRTGAPALA